MIIQTFASANGIVPICNNSSNHSTCKMKQVLMQNINDNTIQLIVTHILYVLVAILLIIDAKYQYSELQLYIDVFVTHAIIYASLNTRVSYSKGGGVDTPLLNFRPNLFQESLIFFPFPRGAYPQILPQVVCFARLPPS